MAAPRGVAGGAAVHAAGDDRRPARDFKAGQLARLARESSIAIVVDDDPEVVAKLRKLGHPVQLADWVPHSSTLQAAQERDGRT